MMEIKAIVFDLDDTLISERLYIQSGYKHISKLLSKMIGENERKLYDLLIKLLNESSELVFNRLFETVEYNYTKSDILYLVEEYRNHLPSISFYDDVLPCIEILKDKGIKTGIITDGYKNAQSQKIKATKANNYFDKIIITDELGKEFWKPHPKPFEMMRQHLGVDFTEFIYVGDNPKKDFYISSIYPVTTIRIIRKSGVYIKSNYYKGIKEDITITSLDEITEVLNLDDWRSGINYEHKL